MPKQATTRDDRPTFSICPTVDSGPISNRSRSTPILANMSMNGSALMCAKPEKPTSVRLPMATPKTSSPRTAGCPRRTARSPPSLAAKRMPASVMATPATGSLCTPVTAAAGAATNNMVAIDVDVHKAARWRIHWWDGCLVADMAVPRIVLGVEFSLYASHGGPTMRVLQRPWVATPLLELN